MKVSLALPQPEERGSHRAQAGFPEPSATWVPVRPDTKAAAVEQSPGTVGTVQPKGFHRAKQKLLSLFASHLFVQSEQEIYKGLIKTKCVK